MVKCVSHMICLFGPGVWTPQFVCFTVAAGLDSVTILGKWQIAWQPLLMLLSLYPVMESSLCNSFEDQEPVDFIYGCMIFKWVAVTWLDCSASDVCLADMPYCGVPGPCLTTAIWRFRKNSSQWQCSFQRKLHSHWLKLLRQRHVAVVRQGPGCADHGMFYLPSQIICVILEFRPHSRLDWLSQLVWSSLYHIGFTEPTCWWGPGVWTPCLSLKDE